MGEWSYTIGKNLNWYNFWKLNEEFHSKNLVYKNIHIVLGYKNDVHKKT